MALWQQYEKFTIAGGAQATFTLKPPGPLSSLAVWAVSRNRSISMTFQPQVNENNFGAPSNIVASPAALLLYSSGGATVENTFLPHPPVHAVPLSADPFVFSVLITNDDVAAGEVTIFATASAQNA